MPRIFLVWLILASVIGWGVYQVKYEVQRLETKLVRLNRGIVADQEMIQVLSAEWSYLNQPQNLEALSRKFLELEPMTGKQFTTIEQIPMRGAAQVAGAKGPDGKPLAKPGLAAVPPPPPPGLDEDDPTTSMPLEEPIMPVAATRATPSPVARTSITGGPPTPPAPRGSTANPPPLPPRQTTPAQAAPPPRAVQAQGVPR